jgi:hypothetical protein
MTFMVLTANDIDQTVTAIADSFDAMIAEGSLD